ncbi:MAG: NCS2 family permease [Candidatus Kryptonium sp.]|nr:NCS2 family permease [Candidatus Kryptonium sp.]MDW8109215.1 NCS2 family permease [Candidatus Kryptonium sp.]
MSKLLENLFELSKRNTNIKIEFVAGVTTFMTMSYIIFVQPVVLSHAGIDFGAGLIATCVGSAIGSVIMALLANYPIALAPGMGQNFFFSYTVVGSMGFSWQSALTIVFLSGVLFSVLSLVKLREAVLDAMPKGLKHSIATGIGLFITLIGFIQAGIIKINSGTNLPQLGEIHRIEVLISIFGLIFTSVLLARGIRGAILIGIFFSTILAIILGVIKFEGKVISLPEVKESAILKLDFSNLFDITFIVAVLVFLYMVLFDTVGTLIGVGQAAGLVGKDGKLPKAERALLSDALATTFGALLGTSTVTAYIESASGVAVGGRTGLTAIFVALFFLISLLFYPIVKLVGGGVEVSAGYVLYPITAPALIIVGSLMVKPIVNINWDDITEAIPAFIMMLGIPLTFSIADGIALGFTSYVIVKLFSGRHKEINWIIIALTFVFLARYIFLALK